MLYVCVTGSLCIANCVFKNALVPKKKLRIIITHHKWKWILTRVIYQHHQQTLISCLQITQLTIWSLSTLFPSPLVTFALSVTDQGNLMQVNSSLACEQTQAAPLYVWQNGECTPLCHFHSDMRQVISRLVMVSYESCRETPAAGSGVQSPANVTPCNRSRERDPNLPQKYNPCSHFAEDLKAPLGCERESLWQLPGGCISNI